MPYGKQGYAGAGLGQGNPETHARTVSGLGADNTEPITYWNTAPYTGSTLGFPLGNGVTAA